MSYKETNKHIKKMAKKERLRNKFYQPAPWPVMIDPNVVATISSDGVWKLGPTNGGSKPVLHQISNHISFSQVRS